MQNLLAKKKQESEGLILLLVRAMLSGAFPVLAILAYNSVLPMDVLVWSTFFAAAYFACVLTIRGRWHDLKNTDALRDIPWIIAITGVGYQMLFFFGLSATSAGNASIVAMVEILFSFLLFNVWHKEHIPMRHIWGALFIVAGMGIILSPKFDGFHFGDVLIIAASAIAPLGNFFQRRVRGKISSEALLFVRSLASAFVLLFISSLFRQHSSWNELRATMLLLAINGVLMLGVVKSLWLEAIHRVSVVKSAAMGSLAPIFTLLIVWVFMHSAPTRAQVLSLVPVLAGFYLLNTSGKDKKLQFAIPKK